MTSFAELVPYVALGAILAAVVVEGIGWRRGSKRGGGVWLVGAAAVALASVLAVRGWEIAFLPLTTKYESFLGFALTLLLVLAFRHRRLAAPGRILLALTAGAALVATLFFDDAVRYPSPLLYTSWYAVHVPISFAGYAFWLGATAHGLDSVLGGVDSRELERRQDDDLRWGLALFSAAMIFGAIWGLVSWGVYFLWDAKIVWSLAAWLYFATFLHLRYWPVRGKGPRVVLGAIGFAVVAMTYAGTSFMSGIHSF